MTDDIQPIIDLFNRFRKATGDNPLTAALLTLAQMLQDRQTELPAPPLPADRFLTLKEAAAYLAYKPYTLRSVADRSRASHRGYQTKGPTIQFFQSGPNSRVLFKKEWLDEFIQQHRVMPQGQGHL